MSDNEAPTLRFRLSPGAAVELAHSPLVKRRMKGRPVSRFVDTTYFDTARQALHRSDLEVRVERTDSEIRQAVRAPTADGASVREWSFKLEGDETSPSLSRLAGKDVPAKLRRSYYRANLRPVFGSEVDRTTMRLKKDGAVLQLDIDVGRLRASGPEPARREELCDATLRVLEGDPASLYALALELIEENDLVLSRQSRRSRGVALAKPRLQARRQKATRIQLVEDMTIAEAFLACARSALDHLAANEALTLGGWPGGIHQSRVAIRRQRAVLRAFKRALPYDSRKAFNYEFRWFQKKMEPARDWHVFLDETLPFMAADGIDKESLDKLRRLAVVERRRESRVAAEYLTSRRFARLILHFERWLELLPAEDPLGKLQRALRPFATKVLERTHRDLTTIDTRPLVHMSSTDLHALRIRGKKARYAGELFRALYPEEVTARQLALLASFQDRLGRANDAATARQIVATIKASRIPARDVALLSDWAEEHIRSCTVAAQPHWRKLQRMEPFWR